MGFAPVVSIVTVRVDDCSTSIAVYSEALSKLSILGFETVNGE
jgi:hypothetical protein